MAQKSFSSRTVSAMSAAPDEASLMFGGTEEGGAPKRQRSHERKSRKGPAEKRGATARMDSRRMSDSPRLIAGVKSNEPGYIETSVRATIPLSRDMKRRMQSYLRENPSVHDGMGDLVRDLLESYLSSTGY